MGVFEMAPFSGGTRALAEALTGSTASPSSAAVTPRRPYAPSASPSRPSATSPPAAVRPSSCSKASELPGLTALEG